MRVIHIESGLGNQMLSYCEYLALKKYHPEDEYYLETIIYDIPEAGEAICQWNGYELKRLFGIDEPSNVNSLFSDIEWSQIVSEVAESRFWEKNWNYPVYITAALKRHGIDIRNILGDFEQGGILHLTSSKLPLRQRLKLSIQGSGVYSNARRVYKEMNAAEYISRFQDKTMLFNCPDNAFTGQRLLFKFRENNIEEIDSSIRSTFKFPNLVDDRSKEFVDFCASNTVVSIHARRGDMLSVNGRYYKSGYFARAVKHIRSQVESPVFCFFSDPGSIEWCKSNLRIFGLKTSDEIMFVDWNSGSESYRDMQLMAKCSHNIITNSSFGWWGAYLNENPNKITVSPEIEINTTYHC